MSGADAALLMMTQQGRNTPNNEVTDMTITTIYPQAASILATAVATIAKCEATFQSTRSDAKILSATADVQKIIAYGHLITLIKFAKIRKGTKRAGELRAALEADGVSKACAKRYCEIAQAAAKLPLVVDAYEGASEGRLAPFTIVEALEENDIKTEAALKNVCFPKVEKSLVEKLAALAESDSDDAEAAVQALLDAAAAINPRAQDVADTLVAALAA